MFLMIDVNISSQHVELVMMLLLRTERKFVLAVQTYHSRKISLLKKGTRCANHHLLTVDGRNPAPVHMVNITLFY